MEYMALWFILGIIFLVVGATPWINRWVKAATFCYYVVLSFIFIKRKEEIYQTYHMLPVPTSFWDKNTEWVQTNIGFFFWPFLLLLIFIYTRLFIKRTGTKQRVWLVVSMLPTALLFCCLMFIFSMYGYRP